MFTRKNVLEIVDALFHEFASYYRRDAAAGADEMMDRRLAASQQKVETDGLSRCIECDAEEGHLRGCRIGARLD